MEENVPSERELDVELARMRRSFRVAIIAAALGATVGAGVVITVVGAVFSVIDRPASDVRTSDGAKGAPARVSQGARSRRAEERASAEPPAQAAPSQASPSQASPAQASPSPAQASPTPNEAQSSQVPCQDQTWPHLESRCLTRADTPSGQPMPEVPKLPERTSPAVAESPATGNGATVGMAPANVAPPAAPTNSMIVAPNPALEMTAPTGQPQAQAGSAPQPQPSPAITVPSPKPAAKSPAQEQEKEKERRKVALPL